MNTQKFSFKRASRYIPQIIVVGLGIGTANYFMHGNFNWLQWSIQSLTTSFIIGYTVVTIGANKLWFKSQFKRTLSLYLIPSILFFLAALLATETEQIIRTLVFQDHAYSFFSGGKMYLYNGIISVVLGLSFFHFNSLTPKNYDSEGSGENSTKQNSNLTPVSSSSETVVNIPAKKGNVISLIPVESIVYFEAFDNYSFVYTIEGEKKLCDYSLLFLQTRLSEEFSRVHRKYIVNKSHIQQIKPYLNGRHQLVFGNSIPSITSSKSYLSTIQKLIKIK